MVYQLIFFILHGLMYIHFTNACFSTYKVRIHLLIYVLSYKLQNFHSLFQKWSGSGRFVRVMPNTPAAVGEAATGTSRSRNNQDFFLIWFCGFL